MPNTVSRNLGKGPDPDQPPGTAQDETISSASTRVSRRRKFQLRRQNLPLLMLTAREAVTAYFRPMFRDFGLTEQQWRILRALYERGETPIGQLADRSFILGPSLTGILQRMVEAGLVVKRLDSEDTRRFYASLTKAGRAKFEAMVPVVERQYLLLESDAGVERINALYEILNDLIVRLGDGTLQGADPDKAASGSE